MAINAVRYDTATRAAGIKAPAIELNEAGVDLSLANIFISLRSIWAMLNLQQLSYYETNSMLAKC